MTKTEQVYGSSLYELALEEKLSKEILDELTAVLALFDENPDYWRFLATQAVSKDERKAALDEAFQGRIQAYLLNFLKILCENGTIASLPGCAREYRRRYNEDNGIVEVKATTAVPMPADLEEKLRAKLAKSLDKTVVLTCVVDKTCMGGVRLELPGRQLDGTVKNRIDTLSASLQQLSL